MDFGEFHIEGQPYGTWVLNATWRSAELTTEVEVTVWFIVGEDGIGTAYIPTSFLDEVFALVYQRYMDGEDLGIWHNSPGLYLNVWPADGTDDYYNFDLGEEDYTYLLSAWSFGGSLTDLVDQLGLGWWPGLAPLVNVAVFIDLGNPIGIQEQAPATAGGVAGFFPEPTPPSAQ